MDLNNDGVKDLIFGNGNGQVRYWQGVGNRVFKNMGSIQVNGSDFGVSYYSYIEATDWNEDGLWDLVIHGKHNWDNAPNLLLLINEGTKEQYKYTKALQYKDEGGIGFPYMEPRVCPTVEDLNYDGKKDIILGMEEGEVRFYPNLGTNSAPEFDFDSMIVLENDGGKAWTEEVRDPKPDFADLNNDGILDAVIGGTGFAPYDYHMYISYGYTGNSVEKTKSQNSAFKQLIFNNAAGICHITNNSDNAAKISVFNTLGKAIIADKIIAPKKSIILKALKNNNYYIVRLFANGKTTTKRLMIVK